MKVLYQPIQDTPGDWLETDSANWDRLGSFPVNSLCVQGVIFGGADHLSVEVDGSEVHVYIWHDDVIDWPPGTRWARCITFRPLAPDPSLGGAINTNHSHVLYVEGDREAVLRAQYAGNTKVVFKGWHEFDPRRVAPMHGRWMQDAKYKAHLAAQASRSWREWNEGLAPNELDANGHLKVQRALGRYNIPDGTKTFFQRSIARDQTTHSLDDADNDLSLEFTTAANAQQNQGGLTAGEEIEAFTFITPSGEPDSAAWPTGNYRCQLEGATVDSEITYGLRDQGIAEGHFARVNSAMSADLETKQQTEALFTTTGLNLATTGSVSWSAGSVADRFECLVSVARALGGHGNQNCHLFVNTSDHFADGPWDGPVGVPGDTPFIGANF